MRKVLTCRVYFPDDGSGNARNAFDHISALIDHGAAAAVQVGEEVDGSWVKLHDCYADDDGGETNRCSTVDLRIIDGDDGSGGEVKVWAPDQTVQVDDQREYDGTVYRCLQAHTTQQTWEPPNAPSLWEPV